MTISRARLGVIGSSRTIAKMHVTRGSPNYNVLTEGRNNWTRLDGSTGVYSWCGDFVTYVLAANHAAPFNILNRVACRGTWVSGFNLIMLIEGAKGMSAIRQGLTHKQLEEHLSQPENVGDVLVLGPNNRHICILNNPLAKSGEFETADGNGIGGVSCITKRSLSATQITDVILLDKLANCK